MSGFVVNKRVSNIAEVIRCTTDLPRAQMKVTNPELGLIFGTARSLLKEYPMNLFLCLDIEDPTNESSLTAIHTALEHLNSVKELARSDSEFVERDGLYHISRVISDDFINKSDQELKEGVALREEIIHNHNSTIRLHSERLGTLDSLVYTEILGLPPLKDDEVEVEVRAAGMNFKDLACAMGVVPANEHMLGFECTGVVREFGKNVTKFNIGDRVVVPNREGGSFANRVRYPAIGVFHLPDWISFEDGTTLGVAMHTALYCLVNLANVQKGQSVLIHSASGGVGLSAIDICKYLGAEIYVTVGTEGKRDFLEKNYGIKVMKPFTRKVLIGA
jgi:Alcohol dehydrogenase GroES-like domain